MAYGYRSVHGRPDRISNVIERQKTESVMMPYLYRSRCITFWTAAFPGLARNTPEMRETAEKYTRGEIDRAAYDFSDMMQRSRLSNVAFIVQSAGEILILAVIVGIMFGLKVNASQANNDWGLSVLIAFASGVWLLLAIPWFVWEKRRPGQPLPPNRNIVSVGFWQLYRAAMQIWRLKQSLLYLVGQSSLRPHYLLSQLTSDRLLPPRRLPKYDRDRNRDSPKHARLLLFPDAHLRLPRRYPRTAHRDIHVLDHPETLLALYQVYVQPCHAWHCVT